MAGGDRVGRHHATVMKARLVLFTKSKGNVLSERDKTLIEKSMMSVTSKYDVKILKLHIGCDMVDLSIEYTPKTQISKLVMSLKCVSSRLLKKESYGESSVKWASTYIASSLQSYSESEIQKLIEKE